MGHVLNFANTSYHKGEVPWRSGVNGPRHDCPEYKIWNILVTCKAILLILVTPLHFSITSTAKPIKETISSTKSQKNWQNTEYV